MTFEEVLAHGTKVFELTDAVWEGPRWPGSIATTDQNVDPDAQGRIVAVSVWFDENHGRGGGIWRLVETQQPHDVYFPDRRTDENIARSALRFAIGRDRTLARMGGSSGHAVPDSTGVEVSKIVASDFDLVVDGTSVHSVLVSHGEHFGLGGTANNVRIKIAGRALKPSLALQSVRDSERYRQEPAARA